MTQNIQQLIQSKAPALRQLRHDLHEYPELGYEEKKTSARVLSELQRLPGLDIRTGLAETGIVATLGAEKQEACVALRVDMDALPIQEESDSEHASKIPGKMHACGHDGHTTCLVGAAQVLCELADELKGPVKFLFQPAEEGGGGGRRMCDEGALSEPEVAAIFALHGWPVLKQGEVGLRTGPVLASSDKLRIRVKGRGAHAAFPHQGVDPVVIAAHITLALQAIAARMTDPLDSVVVTVARIWGGSAFNIIPSHVDMAGTIRTLHSDTRQKTFAAIERIAKNTAAAFGGEAEVEIIDGYPVLENDSHAARVVQDIAEAGIPDMTVRAMDPVMGAEDFAFYSQRIPAAFYALGVCPADRDHFPQLHQPNYDFPDAAISGGVRMHVEIARRFWDHWAQDS